MYLVLDRSCGALPVTTNGIALPPSDGRMSGGCTQRAFCQRNEAARGGRPAVASGALLREKSPGFRSARKCSTAVQRWLTMLFLPAGRAYRAGDGLMICASGGLHRHGTKAVSATSAKQGCQSSHVAGDAEISTTRWSGWSPPPPYTSPDPAAVIAETPSRAAGEEYRHTDEH
ncbi:hypothetical protein CCHR01_14326 [Colletotrichum chrysophilum]|uniref:Uncharacterized protein n=1 Tax=Colletotrichum chrysophilum TaxID=1836956 RepID=A0AAD9A7P4_9PEZI|nr:hypothetical protein CCHR01_14326 [Colletotrichum chrysophilum]